jgi:hypothetical protein
MWLKVGWLLIAVTVGAFTVHVGAARIADPYFPGVTFADRKLSSDFLAEWYGGTLEAMGEPPLWGLPRTSTVYRLLWLPSGHPPIAVRIIKSGDLAVLVVKRLESPAEWDEQAGRYKISHKVAYMKRVPVSRAQWDRLARLIKASHYWFMPTKDPRPAFEDGDRLLIEGAEGGRYHAVDRQRPEQSYLELCRYTLDLGLDVRHIWQEYHSN